jgi:hypothetical protein
MLNGARMYGTDRRTGLVLHSDLANQQVRGIEKGVVLNNFAVLELPALAQQAASASKLAIANY